MKYKHIFNISLLLSVFLIGNLMITQQLLSQNKAPHIPGPIYYSASPIGDASNQMPTAVQPNKQMSPEEQDLLQRLDQARRNNDVVTKEQIEAKLNNMYGATSTPGTMGEHGLPAGTNTFLFNHNSQEQPDYLNSPVNTGSDPWCITTCTNPAGFPNAGRIWCVYTGFSNTVTDTLKVSYSDNGGATWTPYAAYNYGSNVVKFRSSELKCVPVYDVSTTHMYLFIVSAVDYAGNQFAEIYRYDVTGSTYWGADIIFPGHLYAYNTRVCTDNSEYSSNEYINIIASMDSTTSSGHDYKQKFAVLLAPTAATPTITFREPNTYNGSWWWWWNENQLAGQYLSSDIAYYQDNGGTGHNRLMTVWNINYGGHSSNGTNNLLLAWSDDYGLTNAGNLTITNSDPSRGARLAFNGGGSTGSPNRNGILAYYDLYGGSGVDWDYLSYNTTTGGTTTGAWTAQAIDYSSYYASGHPDIIAEWGAANIFKAGYTETISGAIYGMYAGFDGSSWSAPSYLQVTGTNVDSTYTCVNPGYKNGGGDDNIAFYSTAGGTGALGVYCSYNIASTTGIRNTNNGIPRNYSLEQNFPNPFNPTTDIKFSIPNTGLVKLVLYDILGREVQTLINETKQAGNYLVSVDASNLSSGVYFYKLTSGNFTDVKKMSLVK